VPFSNAPSQAKGMLHRECEKVPVTFGRAALVGHRWSVQSIPAASKNRAASTTATARDSGSSLGLDAPLDRAPGNTPPLAASDIALVTDAVQVVVRTPWQTSFTSSAARRGREGLAAPAIVVEPPDPRGILLRRAQSHRKARLAGGAREAPRSRKALQNAEFSWLPNSADGRLPPPCGWR
jgi:hypothetical protein